MTHLPFSPVDSYLRRTAGEAPNTSALLARTPEALGSGEVGERLGVSPRTIARWRTRGVDVWTADALAVSLGMDPCALFGDEWCALIDAAVEAWAERHPELAAA
jgi:hypothetical protein